MTEPQSGPDLGEQLRARGKRLTRQRERILTAIRRAGHATPEEVAALVASDGGPALSTSTIYRCLDALQDLGLVTHTHVDHRVPSYHLADHSTHVHLVCRACGDVDEVALELGEPFVAAVVAATGFEADLTHSAIHGQCRRCTSRSTS